LAVFKFTRFVLLILLFALSASLSVPAAAAVSATYTPNTLDYGIYWFGLGNVSQKSVPGLSNPYYNPARPTVIYIHGWQKDSSLSGRRESFNYKQNDPNYGVDVNMADAWINKGWNIGIFYWNQFADEPEVKNAETKIWTASGPQGMRWRKGDGSYTTVGSPTKSVSELFLQEYTNAMWYQTNSNIRLLGHSLGSQVVVNGAKLISDQVDAGQLPSSLRPKRIALLDPFWSNGAKDYLGGRWPGERAREQVAALKTKGVIFERYKSSNINDFLIGDSNLPLTKMIGQTELVPAYIPNTNQGARHVAAPNLYVHSFAYSPPPECSTDANGNRSCGGTAASAATSDAIIGTMMNSSYTWIQTGGINTEIPSDNLFDRRSR
jgi:uncharacterized protein YjdB